MTMKERPDTSRASTDVAEFMTDLDGGTFEHMLSAALSQTAAACVDFDKKGDAAWPFPKSGEAANADPVLDAAKEAHGLGGKAA